MIYYKVGFSIATINLPISFLKTETLMQYTITFVYFVQSKNVKYILWVYVKGFVAR